MKRATAIGFATTLSAAKTVEEVDAAIRSGLPPLVEASGAILGMIDSDSRMLHLRLDGIGLPQLTERYSHMPVDAAGPFTEVIERGELVVVEGYDAWRDHAPPAIVEDAMAAGLATMVCVPLVHSEGGVVATLAVAWNEPTEVSDAIIATLRVVAELCEQTLERAHATDQATERATRLARLAERLADAMTVGEVLDTVTQNGQAPVGATATSIGLVDEEAGVLRTHHGPSVTDEVRTRFADPALDAPLAFTDAARLKEPVLISDYETYVERYPASADSVSQLGFGARASMPVRTAKGDVIGAIIHAWAGPRTFDAELTSTLTTISEMAGQAIERARLVEQIQRESSRHEGLAGLAELLTSARTTAQVAAIVTTQAPPVAGADSADLALVDARRGCLEVHHNPELAREISDRHTTISLDAHAPQVDALREGTMLAFEDLDQFAARYPHLVDDLKAATRQACAVVPLIGSRGRPLGALGVAWNDPTKLDTGARAALLDVADLCAQAIERAQQADAEHELVATLQDSVLTQLPPMAGIDGAARYLPAARHIGMGGDWYQGLALDDHRYAVIVGDVAGHGITAVGDMAQLKAVTGALVRTGTPLSGVFRETTMLLRSSDRNVTATAIIGLVDTNAQTLTYCVAGHPPPLLRTPDGNVRQLTDARQPLLGVVTDIADTTVTIPFPLGSTLVVYTDGLVERRREPMDRSIAQLATQLSEAPTDTSDAVAEHLLRSNLMAHEPDDDVALVVVTLKG